MSIVNSLTYSNRKRDQLTNNRNGVGYAAFTIILSCSIVIFLKVPNAITQFRILNCIGTVLGFFSSLFYVLTINEVTLSSEAKRLDMDFKVVSMGKNATKYIDEKSDTSGKSSKS